MYFSTSDTRLGIAFINRAPLIASKSSVEVLGKSFHILVVLFFAAALWFCKQIVHERIH